MIAPCERERSMSLNVAAQAPPGSTAPPPHHHLAATVRVCQRAKLFGALVKNDLPRQSKSMSVGGSLDNFQREKIHNCASRGE